jgi:DNA processing protein
LVANLSDNKLCWVGFSFVKGIGAVRFQALLDAFGSAEAAWNAPADALTNSGLGTKLVENLVQTRSQISLEKIWDKLAAQGIQVLTWEDEAYPRHLKEIQQPPPVIYLRGTLTAEDEWSVAIVGTRRMTAYGRQVAEDIAFTLAANGVTVVSGLARGIDGASHQAALNAGGRTLAVLGSGVDRIYPPEHRQLAQQIIENGAILSDYAPGTRPDATNFPPRNRLISGLSLAVVIVEAGKTSGALITAQFAADQGREVFAVPGNINAPQSLGPNRLIRDGDQPLLEPGDILQALNLSQVPEYKAARLNIPANPQEASLLSVIGSEPVHVDDLTSQTGLPVEQVTAVLTMMELKGMVKQVGGMNYVAVRELPEDYQV